MCVRMNGKKDDVCRLRNLNPKEQRRCQLITQIKAPVFDA